MKEVKKNQAISLRKEGYSLKEISEKLNISKSTASLWLRNVRIDQKAQERINARSKIGTLEGLRAIKEYWRAVHKKHKQEERQQAKFVLDSIEKLDKNYCKLLASLIFWCEGGKTEGTYLAFINSDPALIQTFLVLLRKGFNINEKKLRILLHLHEYHNEHEQKLLWSHITSIPLTQFYKTYTKPHTGKRKKASYSGCASIRYGGDKGKTAREIRSIYKYFPKYLANNLI